MKAGWSETCVNVVGALMGIKRLHRNDLAHCCQGSGQGDAATEAQQGTCFQLRPESCHAFDPPGRGHSLKVTTERRPPHLTDRKESDVESSTDEVLLEKFYPLTKDKRQHLGPSCGEHVRMQSKKQDLPCFPENKT